jgi:all-trans-retinol 13,14-reductase
MSYLSLYVGLKHRDGAPDFGCTNFWIYNDADHDASVARFAADSAGPFPALFISFPSAKDPTFHQRYPGRSTIEVIAPASYGWFAQWADTRWKKRGAGYDLLKQGLAERLRNELECHAPAVRGYIDFTELSTPLSTRHFANYRQGEMYGLSAVPARFRLRALGAYTPVRNLYMTGADVVTHGVTGALLGGVVTASLVLGRNLMSVVTRPAPLAVSRAAA